MQVKIFKSLVPDDPWIGFVKYMLEQGLDVYSESSPADYSIVLSGKWENPQSLTGKKILIYAPREWVPYPSRWTFCKEIIKEYYDEMIEVKSNNRDEILKQVRDCYDKYAREGHKQGVPDRDNELL